MAAQRAGILAAANDVLAEGGYAACSIAAVAQRAGVATGTVYNHFASKADLAAQLFRETVTREVDAVREAAAGRGSAAEKITAVIETFAGRAMKEPRRAYALLAEPADPAVDALRLQFRLAFRDVLAGAVSTGVMAGELPPQDAEIVAAALVGAIAEALTAPLGVALPGTALPGSARAGRGTTPSASEPDTVTPLVRFAHRAVGAPTPSGAREGLDRADA